MIAMSRAWRTEYEGALYHLLSWGNERRDIFKDEQDCAAFLDAIGEMSERFEQAVRGKTGTFVQKMLNN